MVACMNCRNSCQKLEIPEPLNVNESIGMKFCKKCNKFLKYFDGIYCPCCLNRLDSAYKCFKDKEELRNRILRSVVREKKHIEVKERKERKAKLPIIKFPTKQALRVLERISVEESEKIIHDNLSIIKQKYQQVATSLEYIRMNDFQKFEMFENELMAIKKHRRLIGYHTLGGIGAKKTRQRSDLPRNIRSPFADAFQIIGLNYNRLEDALAIKSFGDAELINMVRTGKTTMNDARFRIRKMTSSLPRYNWEKKRIPETRQTPFKFCPVCGTKTLERWFNVKEIHCAKCHFYYTLRRRRHK